MPVNAFPRLSHPSDSTIAYFSSLDFSDGTWTLYDPLNFMADYGVVGGENFLKLNAVGSSTASHNVTGAGTGTTGVPRIYKQLFYDNGQAVEAGDSFILSVYWDLRGSAANNLRYFDWYFGICSDPTSTNIGNFNLNACGNAWNFANADQDAFTTLVSGATTSYGTPITNDDTRATGVIQFVGGQGNISAIATDGADFKSWEVQRGTTAAITGVYVALACGTRGTGRVINQDAETRFRLHYKVSKLITGEL